jgi:hypothetical protein
MAGGGVPSSDLARKDYPGKLTGYVLFTCIIAATGGLIFGYDIGISGKYMPPIKENTITYMIASSFLFF